MTNQAGNQVRLTAANWISLIVVIASAAIANVTTSYAIKSDVQGQIVELDDRWQQRTLILTKELRDEMRAIREQIPPDWFRQMVERNSHRIDALDARLDKLD